MNAQEALQQAVLYTDDNDYLMIGLPAPAITVAAGILAEISDPFGAVIVDKDEVTLIIPAEVLPAFEKRLPDASVSAPMRLITFDLPLPPDLIGFMALVAKTLADANISVMPLAAYQRDHILVTAQDFDAAWATLAETQQTS